MLNLGKLAKAFAIIVFGLIVLSTVALYTVVGMTIHDRAFFSSLVLHCSIPAVKDFDIEPISGIKKQVISIACSDGSTIYAWYLKKPEAKKLVIVNHGAGGDIRFRVHIAQAAIDAGYSVLLYDYRGYALSTGARTLDSIMEDGLTVYDYCRTHLKYPAENIVVYGESIGSAVTCHVAKHRNVAKIILQSGVTTLPEVGRFIFPWLAIYPDFTFPKTQIDNVKSLKEIHVPVLFIHGLLDAQVPCNGSKKMYSAANEPKQLVLLPGSGHDDVGRKDAQQYASAIKTFLQK